MTAHVVFDLHLPIYDFGESSTIVYVMALLHSHLVSFQMCSLDIFVDLQPFGCNLNGGLFDPQV